MARSNWNWNNDGASWNRSAWSMYSDTARSGGGSAIGRVLLDSLNRIHRSELRIHRSELTPVSRATRPAGRPVPDLPPQQRCRRDGCSALAVPYQATGISMRTLTRYLSGQTEPPVAWVKAAAHVLGCDPEDLLPTAGDRTPESAPVGNPSGGLD